MSEKIKLDVGLVKDLLFENYDEDSEWTVVEDKITGTWRWGIYKTLILRRSPSEGTEPTFWGLDYQVETSHEDYRIMDLEDESEVELWKAVPVTVVNWKEAE